MGKLNSRIIFASVLLRVVLIVKIESRTTIRSVRRLIGWAPIVEVIEVVVLEVAVTIAGTNVVDTDITSATIDNILTTEIGGMLGKALLIRIYSRNSSRTIAIIELHATYVNL